VVTSESNSLVVDCFIEVDLERSGSILIWEGARDALGSLVTALLAFVAICSL
jgi:hypothetical protein